jgi:hypothetical protein
MIRNRSRRMTVGQLKERIDARFKAVDKRFDTVDKRFDRLTIRIDAGFSSMHDELNAMLSVAQADSPRRRTRAS